MRAIMVMYDSLNRNMLTPYGCDWTHTPNFERLARQAVRFDNCYVGSLPCMPARRELHTGRSNFLHRGWGPLEPFDDSMPEILKKSGVYTHLVSDHQHYWEDGGATYHGRYNSWEFSRGQEGDTWKAVLPVKAAKPTAFAKSEPPIAQTGGAKYHDQINRSYTATEETMPQAVTFENGLEFLRNNHSADNWFLQIETFDPHEPFFTTEDYKRLYPHAYHGAPADWPPYYPVQEDENTVAHVRYEYAALLSMCDAYLGKVLDFMDAHDMWKDTMLIVNTDHGFLLGEHSWWGKSVMPVYDEIAKTPMFVWDPRLGVRGEARQSLVQMVDIAPTLLDLFGQAIPSDMEGKPLRGVMESDTPIRGYAVYGYHGGHVNITDGTYTYMRAPAEPSNHPVFEYTLMPTHMRARFSPEEMQNLELAGPFSFTKGCKVLKIPMVDSYTNPYQFGNKLFHIKGDPGQHRELDDVDTELRMMDLIRSYLQAGDAPAEQYERLGIPKNGTMNKELLLAQNNVRAALVDPGMLEDYAWEPGTKAQVSAMLRNSGDGRDAMAQGFAAYAQSAAKDKTITQPMVLTFLEQVMPPDYVELMKYGLIMLGRSS